MNLTELYADALVWDQHGCLRLDPDGGIDALGRYVAAGVDFASVNVGFDAIPWQRSLKVLASFRRQVLAAPQRYRLVDTADDVLAAKAAGKLAVSFDLEGADALDGRIELVEAYHLLGVRTMLIAYNCTNAAGGGCHDDPAQGLTGFGREVVAEMNRVGMLVDATHCSLRTTLDLFDCSEAPVIFSHSAPAALKRHDRNISDEQMRACAGTGGVVCINGVSLFLGEPDPSHVDAESVFRAVDHAVTVIGSEHVGIGLDTVFDPSELTEYLTADRARFPERHGYVAEIAIAGPEEIPELARLMAVAGYPESARRAILGENMLRVARQVWC